MPTRITHFLHDSVVAPGSPPTLGTAFDVADVHAHDLTANLPRFQAEAPFRGIVTALHVRLESISSATKVTVRICLDAAGDYTLVPDVEATLATGVTTATSGCAAFSVGIPMFQIFGGGTVYVFAKVDAGSATFAQSCITWQE